MPPHRGRDATGLGLQLGDRAAHALARVEQHDFGRGHRGEQGGHLLRDRRRRTPARRRRSRPPAPRASPRPREATVTR